MPRIERLIRGIARKFQIKIYRHAIVGNHIHLMIDFGHRENYKSFVRLLSGQIASHVMGQQSFKVFHQSLKGGDTPTRCQDTIETQGKGQQFFQFRPFTRVLNWGKDFQGCLRYLKQNILEATGVIAYQPRKNQLSGKFHKRHDTS